LDSKPILWEDVPEKDGDSKKGSKDGKP